MNSMKKPTLVSLYSGCGGSSRGFQDAGFVVKYMNDSNPDAIDSLKKNFPDAVVEKGNVRKRNEIRELWDQIGDVDVIEGGFPCQGFSLAGPRQIDDARNELYHYLKRTISLGNPKFFVAENVKGFVTIGENKNFQMYQDGKLQLGKVASAIVSDLERAGMGYTIKYDVLNAMDYGLPQDRKRIIIVGVRKDLGFEFKFPEKTHGPGLLPFVSMKEYGIKDIPMKKSEVFMEAKGDRKDYFSSRYMSRNRIRKWNEVSFTIPAEAGQIPADPSSKTMWNLPDKIVKNVKDSEWAEFRKAHDSYISKSLIRLSWRRCARIQGFPLDYEFCGDIKSKYQQIGNAVPPPMMRKVAECILPYFERKETPYLKRKEIVLLPSMQ